MHTTPAPGDSPVRADRPLPTAPCAAPPLLANRLLALLAGEAPADAEWLLACLEPVSLAQGLVLGRAGDVLAHAWFPQGAVISVVCTMANGDAVEVGTVGLEGMASVSTVLGVPVTPHTLIAQVPGAALRMSARDLAAGLLRRPALRRVVDRFVDDYLRQVAQTAACNRLHDVESRCARWLLLTHDRVGRTPSFPLTQAYLAVMLGVWRSAASVAVSALQHAGYIRSRRGVIEVLDRAGLERASCECYATGPAWSAPMAR